MDGAAARLDTWQLLRGQLVKSSRYADPWKGLFAFSLVPYNCSYCLKGKMKLSFSKVLMVKEKPMSQSYKFPYSHFQQGL